MLSDLRYRLRAIFRRAVVERELGEELEYHYERLVDKLVHAGLPRDDAARRARIAMGGAAQVAEECRDARGTASLHGVVADIRSALRQLRRSPGFSAVVVISLALGIGANTAIFTLIDALLLRPLPVVAPDQLHFVVRRQPAGSVHGFGYEEFRRLQSANPVFADVAAYATRPLNVSIDGSVEPTAEGHLVSGSYFSVLGVGAAAGRTIGIEDDRQINGHAVAVLSHGYWKRRFALDPSVIGRTISVAGVPFTVIGITEAGFFGAEVGRPADLFVPLMMQPTVMPAAENWLEPSLARSFWLTIVGRLADDRSSHQGDAALAGLDVLDPLMTKPRLPGERPERIPERLGLEPAATGLSSLRGQFTTPLTILMIVVATVLLIACANVTGLVLSRSAARTPEFSIRLALGAGTWRLMRLLLLENVLLALLGGTCGLLLARWATGLLLMLMSSGRRSIALDLEPDVDILLFTSGVSILSGMLCGVAPALRARRLDLVTGLKERGRGSVGGDRMALGRIVVVAQIAMCVVLVFGAGLFVRSLQRLDPEDKGLDRERLLTIRVEPRGSDQRGVEGTSQRLDRIYRDLIERVETIPGVRSATMAHFGPTSEVAYSEPLLVPSGEVTRVRRLMVYPRYFETMGIAIRAGRDLDDRDLEPGSAPVAIVNEAFVRLLMDDQDPLGKRLTSPRPGDSGAARSIDGGREVIGVVENSTYANLRTDAPPLVYQPFLQTNTGRGQMTLHVRTSSDAEGVVSRIREEVQSIDRSLALPAIQTLAAEVDAALNRERMVATLSTVFGVLALGLACVGLYGLMAFNVVRRRGEMGIRLALGAGRTTVVRLVMQDAMSLVFIGIALGSIAAVIVGRVTANRTAGLVHDLSTTDPLTIVGAAGVLTLVACVAAYLPAARAARVDPIVALRAE